MKYLISLLIILAIFAVTMSTSVDVALASSQPENTISQSGDLCGGTGGNGQIVSVGSKEFTMKRNDDGRNQIIYLTNDATIKTLTGPISLSELKIGQRVTLVGSPNQDGSFTADVVVLCNGTQEDKASRLTLGARKENSNYKIVSTVINISTLAIVGLIWLSFTVFLRLKKRKSIVYLLFFTIFYVYLYKVFDYTLIQFQSLLLLQHFLPNIILNGVPVGRTVNIIPLITLRLVDVQTSFLNILMMLPFGFGLPFITNFRMKKIVISGFLLSVLIEFLQFVTGFMANTTFRIADVNDLIFNTIGVAIGYILFVGFIRNYRQMVRSSKLLTNPILRYIAERPQS